MPILYQYIQRNNKIKIEILYKESIKQIVEYSKYLPINENDIIKNIESVFIICYQFDALLGIIPKYKIKSLINLSIIIKKQKLFELLLKQLDIDFNKGISNNNEYKDISNYDIAYYLNNYICMLLYKFFKYFLEDIKNDIKINKILQKIKFLPQIYQILIQLYDNNNKNTIIDYISFISDIIHFF